MPRHNDPRALPDGRVKEWRERMADRVTLADGTALDMLDPLSIRAYVRRALAMTIDPSQGQLKRLEMLEEHAARLEAEAPAQALPAKLVLVDAKDAAEELAKRLGTR